MEKVHIRAFLSCVTLPVKAAAAMGAENLAFENIGSEGIDFSVFAFFTDHTPVFLHGVENLMAHNSFMRTGNPDIVFFMASISFFIGG